MAAPPRSTPPVLETARLVLRVPEPGEAAQVADFYHRNREHFAPWDPPRPATFETAAWWQEQLRRNLEDYRADRSLRLFAFAKPAPGRRVVGAISLANFVRGAFQACHLGYSIDCQHEGGGLMSEALQAVLAHAFGPLRMHRVMANHVPTNERSARLLRRLGFVPEGYARDYLYINGRWTDHVLNALVNPDPTPPDLPEVSPP